MSKTTISWTEFTWNPVRGCSMAKGSENGGCLNCYAARMAARGLPGINSPTTGEPFAVMRDSGPRWTGRVELIESMLDIPLRRKKPTTWFVNSMSDLFHEALPNEAIDRVFAVMALCPQHRFQCLTKRAARMEEYCTERGGHISDAIIRLRRARGDNGVVVPVPLLPPGATWWPLPWVWLGVSCEDQKTADERIPHLLSTPAAVRFVSYEPALGPVDFAKWLPYRAGRSALNLIIVGGESGPGARLFDIQWARNTIAQCKAANVPCFVKQLGSKWAKRRNLQPDQWCQVDNKGGDPSEWPEDLRVREFPALPKVSVLRYR